MTDIISQTPTKRSKFKRFLNLLKKDQSGLALIEFAASLPVLVGLGMYGTETAHLATNNLKLSQAALNLADNASRLGQVDSGFVNPTINESDILDIFNGLTLDSGTLDLLENGRVILTGLEVKMIEDPDDSTQEIEQQFIRWRRCMGKLNIETRYDDDKDDDNITDLTFKGMGKDGEEIMASTGSAVMFVELEYLHKPLFSGAFRDPVKLRQEAAFNIRDTRDLGDPETGDGLFDDTGDATVIGEADTSPATCDKFEAG